MSKIKRTQQLSEPLAPPKLHVDPLNMVALRAEDGQAHLVDRNCALVSRRCQAALDATEREVLRGIDEASSSSEPRDAAAPRSTALFFGLQTYRGEMPTTVADAVWVRVPLAVLLENYRRRLLSAAGGGATENTVAARADGVGGSSGYQPQRQGSGALAAPSVAWPPAFAYFEDTTRYGEIKLYPAIDLSDVPLHLLDVSIDFMYYKYRADTDVMEKRMNASTTPSFEETRNTELLIAASVIMEL